MIYRHYNLPRSVIATLFKMGCVSFRSKDTFPIEGLSRCCCSSAVCAWPLCSCMSVCCLCALSSRRSASGPMCLAHCIVLHCGIQFDPQRRGTAVHSAMPKGHDVHSLIVWICICLFRTCTATTGSSLRIASHRRIIVRSPVDSISSAQ